MATKAIRTPLKSALSALASVKADKSVTKGRKLIKTDDKMTVVSMPIEKFLAFIKDIDPIDVQRNDLYRMTRGLAKHLDQFEFPQAVVSLVYLDGKFYMVDGNTRKRYWLSAGKGELPSHVFVVVMTIETQEQGKAIYNCYDSKAAKKTNRDELLSMMRAAGIDAEALVSSLVAGGKLVSVVNNIARVQYCGSSTTRRKEDVAASHAKAFLDLDRLALDEGDIVGGGVWALMRLYAEIPRELGGYVTQYARELKKLNSKEDILVAASVRRARTRAVNNCHELCIGTSGEKPMPAMFVAYFRGFESFATELVTEGRASVKFRQYLPTLKKLVKTELNQVALRIPAVAALV